MTWTSCYVVSFPQEVEDWATWPAVRRILYQVEQFPHTHMYRQEWFWRPFVSPHVVGIWDYTRANLPHYPPTLRPKVRIKPFPRLRLPPGPLPPLPPPKEGPVDVLFYGHGNQRRNQLMYLLAAYLVPRGVSVRYLQRVYGEALQPHIRHAKVVLNLHFFDADTSLPGNVPAERAAGPPRGHRVRATERRRQGRRPPVPPRWRRVRPGGAYTG